MESDLFRELERDKDPYELLPEPVRMIFSRTEFNWLSDREKGTLVQDLTEPDWEE